MIVRYAPDGSVTLITQNDHAKLSGMMAAHWGNSKFVRPTPFESVVRAAHFHDLGWLGYETNPEIEAATGKPPNFLNVPQNRKHLDSFQRSHDWMASIDPYAALLITKHRTGVYQSRYNVLAQPPPPKPREPSSDLKEFILRSESDQKGMANSINHEEFAINFNLLQVW